MATEGKLPLLGFAASAVKFLTLLGFSSNPITTQAQWLTDAEYVVADEDPIYLTAES